MAGTSSNPWLDRQRRRFSKPFELLPQCDLAAASCWADLGCGQGVFSGVLAELLGKLGTILALDINPQALTNLNRNLASSPWKAQIQPVLADIRRPLPVRPINGLLLANILHFFQNDQKIEILHRLQSSVDSAGILVLVEYNNRQGNSAVPYPLEARAWLDCLTQAGWRRGEIRGRAQSSFMDEMVAIQAYRAQ